MQHQQSQHLQVFHLLEVVLHQDNLKVIYLLAQKLYVWLLLQQSDS